MVFLLLAVVLYILIGLFIISKFFKEEQNKDNFLNFNEVDSVKKLESKDYDFRVERVRNNKTVILPVPILDYSRQARPQNKVTARFGVEHIPIQIQSKISYNIHIFYYPWYGNPLIDGKYYHWNHPFLPHWNKDEAKKYQTGTHVPPDDIGANFYPQLGSYSSHDPDVIYKHMAQMHKAGVGE